MRHQRSGKKLGRDAAHRKALYSNLAGALTSTAASGRRSRRRRPFKPIAEQMITLGRRGDLHAGGRPSRSCARRTSSTSSSPRSARAARTRRAATPHHQDRAARRATPPRWRTSSSSTSRSRRGPVVERAARPLRFSAPAAEEPALTEEELWRTEADEPRLRGTSRRSPRGGARSRRPRASDGRGRSGLPDEQPSRAGRPSPMRRRCWRSLCGSWPARGGRAPFVAEDGGCLRRARN